MLVKSKVKYIQSLSQKKLREAEAVFVAEGPKIVNEILLAPNVQLQELFATREWIDQNPHWKRNSQEITDDELRGISFLQSPNMVLGIFRNPVFSTPSLPNKVSLMLDNIQDPGNLGTIVRCADWFGIEHIICSPDCADVFNPKVVQSTMGSICRVNVRYEELTAFVQGNRELPLYAATLQGKDISNHPKIGQGIIIIGNESKGIQHALLEKVENRITIPRKGDAESLNAAVATGIILSHLL